MKYDGDELVGMCGVYVDDFIIAGSKNSKQWQAEKEKKTSEITHMRKMGIRYLLRYVEYVMIRHTVIR